MPPPNMEDPGADDDPDLVSTIGGAPDRVATGAETPLRDRDSMPADDLVLDTPEEDPPKDPVSVAARKPSPPAPPRRSPVLPVLGALVVLLGVFVCGSGVVAGGASVAAYLISETTTAKPKPKPKPKPSPRPKPKKRKKRRNE